MNEEMLLRVENLSVVFEDNKVIHDISLAINSSQIITIIGPNGSGKSTLVRAIIGIIKPSSGKITTRKNLKIGYMPQHLHINKNMPIRVRDFLELSIKYKIKPHELHAVIKELKLDKLLLKDLRRVSGGEMQRILLGKALLGKPDLLILDEPTSNLDINSQLEFYEIIENLRNEKKISILIISHDLHMVMKRSDYVICLNSHICCEGTPVSVHQSDFYKQLVNEKEFKTLSFFEHHHNHKHD